MSRGIRTLRDPHVLVTCINERILLSTGSRKVFASNPLAASRYRDRHGVSRNRSDPGDALALILENILRTDMHAHRPLPADSELAQAIAVLARAQQDTVWSRQQVTNPVHQLDFLGP